MRLSVAAVTIGFCLYTVPCASAQTATVRGFVTDVGDGLPLQGVHVVLAEGDELHGGISNPDGVYVISRIPAGEYVLRASFIGFETFVDTLELVAGDSRHIDITLHESEAVVGEVVIEEEREAGAAYVIAGQQRVLPEDIELIPSPSVSGDLVNYLSAQPGVVSMGDRGGQLFVRGGEPSHNLTLLDGMYLYQPFHVLGFYSAFPSDIINNADIYAGGFGAEFSGRLSSVIDVQTRNGNKRRVTGSGSVTPFVSSALLEGPILEGISFLGSARISTLEQLAARYVDDPLPYRFGDYFAKLHIPVAQNHQTSISGLQTYDRGTLAEPSPLQANNEIRWTNRALGIRHIVLPRSLPILGEASFSYSNLESEFGPSDTPARYVRADNYSLEANFTNFVPRRNVDWGFFLRNIELTADLGGAYQNLVDNFVRSTNAGAYVEPTFELDRGLQLRTGLVGQFFGNSGFYFEPRIRALLDRGIHHWSAAAGLYRQNIVGVSDRRDAANIFTAYAEAPTGEVPYAIHLLAGYRVTPLWWLELSAEGFYKHIDNLYIAEWTAFPRFTTRLQPATGRAMGVDLRIEIRRPRFYAFMNYGLSSTRYDARQETLPIWFGTDKLSFRPPHDRRHQVNVVASFELAGFDVNARWNFGSGLPYTRVRAFDLFILMEGVVDVSEIRGFPRVIYDRPFKGILPTYHRLDVSVSRTITLGPAELKVQVGAINLYDRANLFALDVFTAERTDQLPIVPTAGLEVSF